MMTEAYVNILKALAETDRDLVELEKRKTYLLQKKEALETLRSAEERKGVR